MEESNERGSAKRIAIKVTYDEGQKAKVPFKGFPFAGADKLPNCLFL
jgi:hypothetical protein